MGGDRRSYANKPAGAPERSTAVAAQRQAIEQRGNISGQIDTHPRASMRAIGRLVWPAMCLYRTFRSRIEHLRKPAQ
jgi:hypothetical protein